MYWNDLFNYTLINILFFAILVLDHAQNIFKGSTQKFCFYKFCRKKATYIWTKMPLLLLINH